MLIYTAEYFKFKTKSQNKLLRNGDSRLKYRTSFCVCIYINENKLLVMFMIYF